MPVNSVLFYRLAREGGVRNWGGCIARSNGDAVQAWRERSSCCLATPHRRGKLSITSLRILTLAMILAVSVKAETSVPPLLENGPLVVFGDSTTAPREGTKVYAESLAEAFADRGWDVEIVNAGVGGNTTRMAKSRFEADVLGHSPSTVIVQFGINDSAIDLWKDPPASRPRVSLEDFRANLEFFVDEIRERGGTAILMTPNAIRWTPPLLKLYGGDPYDPDDENGFNRSLEKYAETVREVAGEKNLVLIDVFAAYKQLAGPEQDALLSDGMHPNNAGHALVYDLLIAEFLKTK